MSSKNERLYSMCMTEAAKSILLYQHACIATRGGKIMARGYNSMQSRRFHHMVSPQASCHAEIKVLYSLKSRLLKTTKPHKINKLFKKTTLYLSRVQVNNNSAPCSECLRVIRQHNIKRIVFHLNDTAYIMNPRTYNTEHCSRGQRSGEY